MKGFIVIAKINDPFDRLAPDSIERIVVILKDKRILAMTDYNKMHAVIGYNYKKNKIIREIEVPDELIEKALAAADAEEKFNAMKDVFNALLKNE